jgi:hypothetical protein
MPGDTPMSYPFPYKTSDGLLVDNSTGPVVIPEIKTDEIKTDEIIITQGYTDAYSISTSIGPPRGLIRTLDEAFGFDIDVQGTGKLIRLMTDDIVRTTVEDTKVTISNALDVLGQVKGITIEGTQLISTIATGTTPLLVTSTTVVPNLNVSQLLGNTWTIPGTIGSTTANTGTFTTLTATTLRGTGTTFIANDTLLLGISTFDNCFIDRNFAGGNFIWGWNTPKIAGEHAIQQFYNNATDRNPMLTIISKGTSSGTDRVLIGSSLNVSNTLSMLNNAAITMIGSSSGSVSIKPNTTGSAWNFVLPNGAGTAGEVLVSGAGSVCSWTSSPTFTALVLGTATATSITCTTLSTATLNGTGTTTLAGDTLLIGPSGQDNLFIDRNIAGGNFIWGYNTARLTTEHFIHQWYNNATNRNLLMSIVSKGSVSGTDRIQITCPLVSTLVTGTAPFTIASTTVVPNLNVSQLLGNTWAIPGAIGSTTPTTGAFTTLTASSTITGSSTVTGTQLVSTIAIGTAPLTVTSTTVVPNLNVSQLLGNTWAIPGAIGSTTPTTGAFTTLTASSTITGSSTVTGTQLVSTIAIGTAPLTVTSTTVVPNLNVSQLLGNTWAIPGTIGSTTPSTGAFTTLTASSTITATQLISTVAIGTAPLTVTSTTVVPNLNVSQLLGNTWVIPGTIGSTTPNTGNFTTLTLTTLQGSGTIQGANDKIVVGPSGTQNAFFDRNRTGGTFIFGFQTPKDLVENVRFQVYNNETDKNLLFAVHSKGSSSGTDRVEVNTTLNVSGNVNVGGGNSVTLIGSSSGSVSIKPNTTGSAWNFVLPNGAGTAGQVLVSGAGSVCSWTSSPTFTALVLGTVTATSITCTTLSTATLNGTGTTTLAGDTLLIGPSGQDNLFIDRNIAGGNFIWGYNTARLTTEHFIHQWYNNATDRNLLMYITSKGSSSGTNRIGLNALTVVSHASVVLANFYPSTTGPASITIQSNSAGSKVLEMGVANINTEFSSSSLAGDGIIRNSTGGRVLVQSGTGAAALTIGSGGVYFGTSIYAYTYRYDGMTVSLGVDTGSLGTVTITQNICQIVSCGYSCTVLVSVEGSFTGGSSWTNLYLMLSSFLFGSSFIQKTPAWVEDMPGTNGSQSSYCRWTPNGSNPKLYLINNNSLVSSASTSGSFKIYSNGVVINF